MVLRIRVRTTTIVTSKPFPPQTVQRGEPYVKFWIQKYLEIQVESLK